MVQPLQSDWSLLRYCSRPVQIVPNAKTGGLKISSQAFKPRKGESGVSVDVEELRLRDGHPTSRNVPSLKNVLAVLRVKVHVARKFELNPVHEPIARNVLKLIPPNPYHAELLGALKQKQLSKLRDACEIALPIDVSAVSVVKSRLDRYGVPR